MNATLTRLSVALTLAIGTLSTLNQADILCQVAIC